MLFCECNNLCELHATGRGVFSCPKTKKGASDHLGKQSKKEQSGFTAFVYQHFAKKMPGNSLA